METFSKAKTENVISIMDKLMIVVDGENIQDSANALQYVLNLIHCGTALNQNGPAGPQIAGKCY